MVNITVPDNRYPQPWVFLNLANYALSLDKYDREAQDIKYEILYRLKRGEEAEAFIEEILLGE